MAKISADECFLCIGYNLSVNDYTLTLCTGYHANMAIDDHTTCILQMCIYLDHGHIICL